MCFFLEHELHESHEYGKLLRSCSHPEENANGVMRNSCNP